MSLFSHVMHLSLSSHVKRKFFSSADRNSFVYKPTHSLHICHFSVGDWLFSRRDSYVHLKKGNVNKSVWGGHRFGPIAAPKIVINCEPICNITLHSLEFWLLPSAVISDKIILSSQRLKWKAKMHLLLVFQLK